MMAISLFAIIIAGIVIIVALSGFIAWVLATWKDSLPGVLDLSSMNAKQLDETVGRFTALLKAGTITSGQADVLRLAKSYRARISELTSEEETHEQST